MSTTYDVRAIASDADRAAFLALPGAPVAERLASLLEEGATQLSWCFIVSRAGVDVGRLGLFVEPTAPPELLGDLPPRELWAFGLALAWEDEHHRAAGRVLVTEAIRRVAAPERLQVSVNLERDDHPVERRRLFDDLGMKLFQEKQGFVWEASRAAGPERASRLEFRTVAEVGRDAYRLVLGRVGAGTLDRNDEHYRRLAGERNWASVFMTFLAEADAPMWLLATLPGGEPVGIVAMSRWDDATATITFVGVVPEQRGHGYIDDLVRAGTAAAHAAGYRATLSDADVLNGPMCAAFERCGHRSDVRAWHKWHFRF